MYVCICETCKWNKATLSWLRLVCCRHEVPVTSEPITVIHMDEDVVVVNKPASIPVSGVLPELYCQKIVCVVYCLPNHTHTYIHIHTHIRTHYSSRSHAIVLHEWRPSTISTQSYRLTFEVSWFSINSFVILKSIFMYIICPFILKIIPRARSRDVRDPLNLESPNYILLRFSEETLVSSKYIFMCFVELNFTPSTIGSADIRSFTSLNVELPISLAVSSFSADVNRR